MIDFLVFLGLNALCVIFLLGGLLGGRIAELLARIAHHDN